MQTTTKNSEILTTKTKIEIGLSVGYLCLQDVRVEKHWQRTMIILEPENEINCMDFSQDGDQFATAGRDHCIRIYDTETLKVCNFSLTVEENMF